MKNITTQDGTSTTTLPRRVVSVSCYSKADCYEVAQIDIDGQPYKLLCIDTLVASSADRDDARPPVRQISGEAATFQLNGHLYSLVPRSVPDSKSARNDRDPVQLLSNIRELLTNRELQIVQLICMGCLTKQVASRLRLSEFTVRSYLKTIYCKLGVRSRGAMVFRYAQSLNRATSED